MAYVYPVSRVIGIFHYISIEAIAIYLSVKKLESQEIMSSSRDDSFNLYHFIQKNRNILNFIFLIKTKFISPPIQPHALKFQALL